MSTAPPTIADAELWLDRATRRYAPGERLVANYRLAAWNREGVTAIETSVLWLTAGVGEEDFGVHFFERRRADADAAGDGEPEASFQTVLPTSPLSYDGQLIKVCWVARLRGFFPRGRQRVVEEPFVLRVDAGRGGGGRS